MSASTDRILPRVAALEALPGVCAVLTLEDGARVTVGPSDRAALTPASPEDLGLLIRWADGPDASSMYRVPPDLAGRMAWATGCRPARAPRLMEVRPALDSLTFTASQGGECIYTLTVPRWASVSLGRPLPRFAGMPVDLTITDRQEGAPNTDTRAFFFEVYPEDPDGAACLEALGLIERVGLPDGEGEAQ